MSLGGQGVSGVAYPPHRPLWRTPPSPHPCHLPHSELPLHFPEDHKRYMSRLDNLKMRPRSWWGSFSPGPLLGRLQGAPLRRKLLGQDSVLSSFPVLAESSGAASVAWKVNPHC